MSTASEVVQSAYAAFGRGDIPALLALLTEDVAWQLKSGLDLPYHGSFRGKPAVAQWFAQLAELDNVQAFEPREFLAGADHVTVLGWERVQPMPKGRVYETDWIHLFQVRDGRISRFVAAYDTAASAAARR